ncbi:MAG TPA: Spy/CpxP family protein refolding chaperone [Burkholderiaceae bacterium]|nr:Spy/CpxP family protein refolding chaperone [Burkholderiaceae bacterium]
MTRLKALAIGTIAALAIGGACGAYAEESTAYQWGPAMMGGPGGAGPNAGWGPGYRGGYGMMGGRGMGAGMMGYGMGFMSPRTLASLDLTEAQRKQIVSVQDELRKKNWGAMGAMQDEMVKVRDAFWAGEKRDRTAILAGNKRMFEIRQQMLENSLDAADRIDQVLTPQQRAQLKKQVGPAWMMEPDD